MKKNPLLVLGIFLVMAVIASDLFYTYGTKKEKVVKIKSLDHKLKKSGSGEDAEIKDTYMVFTENDGVFENVDAKMYWKFNSSDIQNALTAGKEYTITYYGWRVPFLSWYPNVVAVKPK
jgi:hypothetical protein